MRRYHLYHSYECLNADCYLNNGYFDDVGRHSYDVDCYLYLIGRTDYYLSLGWCCCFSGYDDRNAAGHSST